MKNRLISIIMAIAVLMSAFSVAVAAESYWDAQKAYIAALESGDGDAILDAVSRIEAVYPNPSDATEYSRVTFPQREAAFVYESRGQFDLAAERYGRFLSGIEALAGLGQDYSAYKNTVNMLYRHNAVTPTVYAETFDTSNIPNYGARNEDAAGVMHGMSGNFDENCDNARIMYVQFFDEDIEPFKWQIPKTEKDFLLMVAWNVPNEDVEDLRRINSGEADEYMRRNLEYLSTLNCRVLIRFGAEVNCWASLPSDRDEADEKRDEIVGEFISAFRRVSTMAREFAPNAGMIYSPNDISNYHFSVEEFYPGDEYVDWVGMSAYCNRSSKNEFERSDGGDAYYCHGDYYENQIVKIQPIVEAFSDRKPIIITEGGYCYRSSSGVQNEEHAAEAMRFFYTYVSRVYPQIKCIMYFNTNFGGSYYKLVGSGDTNPRLLELYRSLNAANCAMNYSMTGTGACGYTDVRNIDEYTDELCLSVYADYPSKEKTAVTYELDGALLDSAAGYPYECNIQRGSIGIGSHLLHVNTACENTVTDLYYKVTVSDDGKITVTDAIPASFEDVPPSFWGRRAIAFGMAKGLFTGTSDTTFQPNSNLTRAMFVTILGRMAKVDAERYEGISPFDDTSEGKWYAPYVAWAKENDIVNGIDADHFAPDDDVTREQICVLIDRFSEKYSVEIVRDADSEPFADDDGISDYASDSVYVARASGLVSGRGENRFEPDASASRAEAATIFMRFIIGYYGIKS